GRSEDPKSIPADILFGSTPETIMEKFRDAINKTNFSDSCSLAKKTHYSGVIYPGTLDGYFNAIAVKPELITDQIAKGFGFIIIKGCFTYETMKETHTSKYCFFYNKIID